MFSYLLLILLYSTCFEAFGSFPGVSYLEEKAYSAGTACGCYKKTDIIKIK